MNNIKKLSYFLIGWQVFDILIHILSNNFEILRVSANVIVMIWAILYLKKSTSKAIGYLALFLNIALNFVWLAIEGFVLQPVFVVLILTTILSQVILIVKR